MMRATQWEEDLAQHVRRHLGIYFFVILLFAVGVVFGALAVKTLTTEQKAELIDYLNLFLQDVSEPTAYKGQELATHTVWSNLKGVALIWFSGLTVVGLPLALVLLFTKGFTSGFTVGFLVDEINWRGLLVAGAAVLPQSLLTVPAIVLSGAGAVCFSVCVVQQRLLNRRAQGPLPLFSYGLFLFVAGAAAVVAGLVEAYITPVLLKGVMNWVL